MRRFRFTMAVLLSTSLALGGTAPFAATKGDPAMAPGVVAVVPPETVVAGRVVMKDGVTPISGAELQMTGDVDDTLHASRSDRSGRFKIRLPAGRYQLRIVRQREIYKAPSVYRVPAGGRVDIDFLLLRDFEPAGPADPPGDPPPSIGRGPDPLAQPAIVGSVVDMVHSSTRHPISRWAEALGFLGSLLVVGLAGR